MERKWTDIEYHVQDNSDVANQDVKIYCNTNQFPALPFYGPHSKPHVERGIGNNYHLCFDPKLGMAICAILRIPMLDKHWTYDIPSNEQERYKPVTKCTYWPVLGSFNNCNINQFSQKSNPSDAFD